MEQQRRILARQELGHTCAHRYRHVPVWNLNRSCATERRSLSAIGRPTPTRSPAKSPRILHRQNGMPAAFLSMTAACAGDAAEGFVAGKMPEAVVDPLEAVQVQKDDGEGQVLPL